MRRWRAIVKATILEMSSEPLALLLTLSSIAIIAFASVFHIHQFGGADSSRMARDAGFSVLLVIGIAYAVFCTVKVFRREIESGTAQMALAHPVSRAGFFVAKASGAFLSYAVFALTVFGVTVTTVVGAKAGGIVARRTGDIAFIWGPALAIDAAVAVLPLVLAAVMDRFFRCRFTTAATWLSLAFSLLGAAASIALAVAFGFGDGMIGVPLWLAPAAVMLLFPAAVFVAASAAFSVRVKEGVATALAGALFMVALPAFGNYYLSSALSKGATIPWRHVLAAGLAAVPFAASFGLLGIHLFNQRDIS